MDATNSKPILHDVPPYIRVYTDGTVERFLGIDTTPAAFDPETGVTSKDVVINKETSVSARLYRPANHGNEKLPLVVYFHGGAFCISSTADPLYHNMLNMLVNQAKIILVSINYRLSPEHPLPAAYDDSWDALQWVASHDSNGDGTETWLTENADFQKLFLAGDSAGANISHHMAIKAGKQGFKLKIVGILMVQPYFWGEKPIGVEIENPVFKAVVDQWWLFVCPSDLGCDDPLINPFADGSPGLEELACDKILVCVAGNDVLRERGKVYHEALMKSKWNGKTKLFVSEGEDHVFHIIDPKKGNSINLIKLCAEFINHD